MSIARSDIEIVEQQGAAAKPALLRQTVAASPKIGIAWTHGRAADTIRPHP